VNCFHQGNNHTLNPPNSALNTLHARPLHVFCGWNQSHIFGQTGARPRNPLPHSRESKAHKEVKRLLMVTVQNSGQSLSPAGHDPVTASGRITRKQHRP
jgi:hypothetical protein